MGFGCIQSTSEVTQISATRQTVKKMAKREITSRALACVTVHESLSNARASAAAGLAEPRHASDGCGSKNQYQNGTPVIKWKQGPTPA